MAKRIRDQWKVCDKSQYLHKPDLSQSDIGSCRLGQIAYLALHRQRLREQVRAKEPSISNNEMRRCVEKIARSEFAAFDVREQLAFGFAPLQNKVRSNGTFVSELAGQHALQSFADEISASLLGPDLEGQPEQHEICADDSSLMGSTVGTDEEEDLATPALTQRGGKRCGSELAFGDLLGSGGGRRTKKKRKSELCNALDAAIGPSGAAIDVRKALQATLSESGWKELSGHIINQHTAKEEQQSPWTAWMGIGSKIVRFIQDAATLHWRWPIVLLAKGFREAVFLAKSATWGSPAT